jgi:lipase chaperone LimK
MAGMLWRAAVARFRIAVQSKRAVAESVKIQEQVHPMKLDYDDLTRAKLAKQSLRTRGIGAELTPDFMDESVLVHRLEVNAEDAEEAARHLRLRGMLGTMVE